MALPPFRPVLMYYILDKIDAAFDLSHTQCMGMLFRTRFRGTHRRLTHRATLHDHEHSFPPEREREEGPGD
jgi:hypothetical protein